MSIPMSSAPAREPRGRTGSLWWSTLQASGLGRRAWVGYVSAVSATVAALLVRYAIDRALPPGFPYLTFFPAVILTTFFCGIRPGILCATLSGIAAWYFFIPPYNAFVLNGTIAIALGLYAFVVGVDILLIHGLQRTAARLHTSEATVHHLYAALERESERRFRLLADNTTDLIFQVDLDLTRSYVSPAAREILGYEPDELLGTKAFAHTHPEDQAAGEAFYADLFAGRASKAIASLRYQHRDGHYVWLELRAKPLNDENGRPAGCVACLRDISDRVAAEQALLESERRYRLIAENTRDLIVQVDMDTTRRYVSPACRDLLGYEPEELIGTKPLDMVHPDDRDRVRALLSELSDGRRTEAVCRQRYRRKDGTYVWVEVGYQIFHDEDGQPQGCIACTRDITEQKRQETALQEAKHAAECASAAKSEFLAAMSHEIRTPLNAIIGFTDLMVASGRLPLDLQRQAELVRKSGAALLTVVNDILDFSKVEAGAVTLELQAFTLRALIHNCISIVKGSVGKKDLNVRAIVDPALPQRLFGDEARLRQVLLNLLNNAIKFTEQGSVVLNVQHEDRRPDGVRLRFSITDTGIGISKNKQHRLFQRFSQVDSSIERQFGGTGLGLAICKKLVELMGGEIGLFSEEGAGSTFWFALTLPLGASEEQIQPAREQSVTRRRARLLLVEDNTINQELARATLEVGGHEVDVVGNGASAIQALKHDSYDLVLMDVQMPGMDGVTATRHIRQLSAPSGTVPIVAMTANVLPDQLRLIRDAGMDDHIGKPFNRAELYTLVDKWIAWNTGTPSPSAPVVSHAPAVLNQMTYNEVLELVGPERLIDLLRTLVEELGTSFSGDATSAVERGRLRYEAHVVVSSAGMLGFAALAAACRALEACNEQSVMWEGAEAFEQLLEQLREVALRTSEHAKELLTERHIGDTLSPRCSSRMMRE